MLKVLKYLLIVHVYMYNNVQAFEYIDKDGDGIISLDDLKAVNDLAKVGLSYEELTELVEEADKDGDGVISKQDFISVMKRTNLFK